MQTLSPFEKRVVKISDLLFDLENPRIYLSKPKSQNESLEEILRLHGSHTFALAKHITQCGLLDDTLVITDAQEAEDKGKYVVKEGNRRLAAIKLLLNPEKCPKNWKKKFSELSKKASFAQEAPQSLECRYSDDLELIETYMNVRHGGVQEGIGTVPWTPLNRAMDQLKRGDRGKEARAAAAIRYASALNCFPYGEDYPISTLWRFLTKENMKKLGIKDIFCDPPKLTVDEGTIKKRLCYIIKEIAKDGDKDSRNLSSVENRKEWLDEILHTFPASNNVHVLVNNAQSQHKNAQTQQQKGITGNQNNKHNKGNKKTGRNTDPNNRKYIFLPKNDHGIQINNAKPKTKSFYKELENLDVEKLPMLAAIGLRTLLELATAHCETKLGITPAKNQSLPDRVKTCAKKMWGKQDTRTNAISNTVSADHYLSLKALNQVVHNEHFPVTKKEVFAIWSKLRPYVSSCFE